MESSSPPSDLLGRSNLLSLPAELLVQIAKELYTPPTSNLETGILLTRFYRMPRAPEVRPLDELHAEAEQELQVFTLLHVNCQLRTIALGVFQTMNGRDWNTGTHAQRLDNMREEEARILYEKVCGVKRDFVQEPANADFFAVMIAEHIKAWEKKQGFARHPSVWEKVLSRTGATASAFAFTLALWKDGQTGHTGMCLPSLRPLARQPPIPPMPLSLIAMPPLPIVPRRSLPQGYIPYRPPLYHRYSSDLYHR